MIEGLRTTVVIVGQRMEMKCQVGSNSTIRQWSLQRPFTSSSESILNNFKERLKILNSHFGIVDGINGSVVLYTNYTELNDAGIYTCSVQKAGRQPDRYSAQLIVFETEPLCETNLTNSQNGILEEGAVVWMRCRVKFRGIWTPTLEWSLNDDNGETEQITGANVVTFPNANISSTLTILLNATSNSSYFSCKIYFTPVSNAEMMTAKNTPDYNYIWKSPVVTVIPATQWKERTTDESVNQISGMDIKTISVVVLSILFGAAISSVVIIVIYMRRKKSSGEGNHPTQPVESLDDQSTNEYHTIYDHYDAIEEVEITDDVVAPHCCAEDDSFPKPNNYALSPTSKEVSWTYTDINIYEQPVDMELAFTAKILSDAK